MTVEADVYTKSSQVSFETTKRIANVILIVKAQIRPIPSKSQNSQNQ